MNRASAYVATLFTALGDRFAGRKDRGATAVEYGLLIGLIAVVIIAVVLVLGEQLAALFQGVSDNLPAVEGGAGGGEAVGAQPQHPTAGGASPPHAPPAAATTRASRAEGP